jgi:hypothetical protein
MAPRRIIVVFGLVVALLAAVSIGAAWLNPANGVRPVAKPVAGSTLFWQWDLDSYGNMRGAAFFPGYFTVDPTRMERPASAMTLNLLTEGLYAFARVVAPGEKTYMLCLLAGLTVMKAGLYMATLLFAYDMFRRHLPPELAAAGAVTLLASDTMILAFAQFHAYEMQVVSATAILWLAHRLVLAERLGRDARGWLVGGSLAIGFLMMFKSNYAAYVAVLGLAVLHRRWWQAGLSFALHLVPLVLWVGIVKLMGLRFYVHTVEGVHQVVWMKQLLGLGPVELVSEVWAKIFDALQCLQAYFGLWLIPAGLGLALWVRERGWRSPQAALAVLMLAGVVAQIFVSGRYAHYMTADAAPAVAGLAWYAVSIAGRRLNGHLLAGGAVAALALLFAATINDMVQRPWLPPDRQVQDRPGHAYGTTSGLSFLY